jgi:hypothetical protein
LIDDVFAHHAPIAVLLACGERFLMTEAVSSLTQPRGVRSDYHMLMRQWRHLFEQELDESFACLCDATAYASATSICSPYTSGVEARTSRAMPQPGGADRRQSFVTALPTTASRCRES